MSRPSTTLTEADVSVEERSEAERHDRFYASQPSASLVMEPADWEKFESMDTPLCAYHASMLRLGDVRGLRVLDAGCGDGWLSVILAKRGATVDGFDISPRAIQCARRRAVANGVADMTAFEVASFYSLPYDDARYDAVIGQAILHHLREKGQVARELYRVLKPRARAIFSEPFGNSSWLERLRLLVPVPSGAPDDPTEWTRQLKYTDLEPFRSLFEIDVAEMQLLSRLERLVSSRRLVAWLKRFDVSVLRTCPWLRRYARTIVVELRRR